VYPVIQVAGLTLQTAGVMALLAGWLGLSLAAREARRLGINGEIVWDAGFFGLLAGLLGARLWYVGANWAAYQSDLRQVLALNLGTLAPGPGMVIGALVALIYLYRRGVSLPRLADALAPGLLLALAVLRVGDFLTGRVLGTPTDIPWAVEMWDVRRHPVALYEAGAVLIALGIIWRWGRNQAYDGFVFLLATFLASAARLFVEAYRLDSTSTIGGVRVPQLIALAVMWIALGALYRKHFAVKERVNPERRGVNES
jgi:phosphatidylglycerol:prolipoprotein diacylglycerol transferase